SQRQRRQKWLSSSRIPVGIPVARERRRSAEAADQLAAPSVSPHPRRHSRPKQRSAQMKRITLVMTALSALYSGSGCVGAGEDDGVESRKEEIVTNGPSFPWTPHDLCIVSRPDGTLSTTMLCCP